MQVHPNDLEHDLAEAHQVEFADDDSTAAHTDDWENDGDDSGATDAAAAEKEGEAEEREKNAVEILWEEEIPEVVLELEVSSHSSDISEVQNEEENTVASVEEKGSPPTFGNFSVETLSVLPGGFQYYTSFSDYEHFKYVFGCLGPAAYNLRYQCKKLKPEDEFLLLLIKLRLNKDDKELGFFFGISPATVGYVFKTWLNFLYFQLKELNLWTPKEQIQEYMPADFKAKYPSTRCIVDGTEIPIEKPSNAKEQSCTWSSYKNKNTLKVMIGISPRGDVTHVSDAYGGSASDRQIVERSELLEKDLVEEGDSIMADRGFIVQDLFCLKHVQVNTPTVMRGLTQLPAEKVIRDRRIASKRVHVERIIGLGKVFRILTDELDHSYVPLGGRLLYVCFALTNFKSGIIDSDA